MGNLHLVTGHAGQGHITAADHGSLNASIFGTGQYVLNRGSKFAATVISNNAIRIADGDILLQGRHVRLNENSYVDLTIENGAQDMLRNDLIVARYSKDSTSGVEDCNLIVIKGTPASADPVDPEYMKGDLMINHDLTADMPLYRVPLNGLAVQELVPLFESFDSGFYEHTFDKANPHNTTATQVGAIPILEKGTANGVATLNSNGVIPEEQLPKIINTKNGAVITAADSAESPFYGLTFYGKTTQDGTPTPEEPVELVNAGASGTVTTTLHNKNLLQVPYYRQSLSGNSYTSPSGVVFTTNADGSITMNGTNTSTTSGDAEYAFTARSIKIWLEKGTYTINTGADLSNNTWYLKASIYDTTEEEQKSAFAYGGDETFTVTTAGYLYMVLRVQKGQTVDNVTVYPQLEVGEVATEYEQAVAAQTLTIQTPNGLAGIPVETGGNYTDSDGQQWICDEIDFARGVKVQRIGRIESYNGESVGDVFMSSTGELSTGATVIYPLAKPIETPLTADELGQYAALRSNKPNTTVLNNGGCDMKVSYFTNAETKEYVDFILKNFGAISTSEKGVANGVAALDENGKLAQMPSFEEVGGINKNLLHNWYFPNPVNNNGLTVYPQGSSAFFIDRWMKNGSLEATISDEGLTITASNSHTVSFYQFIKGNELVGKTITASVLLRSSTTPILRIYYYDGTTQKTLKQVTKTFSDKSKTELLQFTAVVPDTATGLTFQLFSSNDGVEYCADTTFIAVKLEIGSIQTLAYQNTDGNWTLTETPDFAEQAAICAQYDSTTIENWTKDTYLGSAKPFAIPQTYTASMTLQTKNIGNLVAMFSSSDTTVTIPTDEEFFAPVGAELEILRYGTGAVTIIPATDVSLFSVDAMRNIGNVYGSVTLKKMSANKWLISGDLG